MALLRAAVAAVVVVMGERSLVRSFRKCARKKGSRGRSLYMMNSASAALPSLNVLVMGVGRLEGGGVWEGAWGMLGWY